MKTDVYCSICEKEIECQSKTYSLDFIKEYLEDGEYSVKDCVSYMTACWECFNTHSIEENININLYKKLCLPYDTKNNDKKVQALNSHYACFQCGEKIADGSYISTVNHIIEEFINKTGVEAIDCNMGGVFCNNCSDEAKLVVLLEEVVGDLVSGAKRNRMRLV